jgi:hypothetical protein
MVADDWAAKEEGLRLAGMADAGGKDGVARKLAAGYPDTGGLQRNGSRKGSRNWDTRRIFARG